MGACWSNRIKAESPFNTGVNSKNVSRDRNDLSSSSSKLSSASVPPTPRSEGEILQSSNIKSFSFSELKTVTRNFRPDSVLGEGGFGSVFKGWIDEHSLAPSKPGIGMVVAVKRLNQEGLQGHKEWLAEINYLGQLQHTNLVELIGYCCEDEHRLLVYEFMPRGSMENHLFRRGTYFLPLSWSLRMKIALGAAKGLAFLHNAETQVIYRDFKTSNILLDSNYNAKLSDFGLARDGPTGDKSHVSTRVMGTYGYPAPEYLATGHLTAMSDVYSFGVVFLEMLSGRRVVDKNRPSGQHNLVEWAKPYLINKRRIFRVLDGRLDGQYPIAKAQKAASLALQCLSTEPKNRPNMDEVVTVLEQLQDSKNAARSPKTDHQLNHRSQSTGGTRTFRSTVEASKRTTSYPRANLAFQCFSTEPKFRPKADEVVTALEQLQDSKNTAISPKEDCQLNHRSESTGGTCTFQSTVEVSKGTTAYPRADLALQCLSTEPEIRPKVDEVVPALEQLDSKNSARSPKTGQQLNLRSRFAGGTWTFRGTVEASKRSTSYPRPNLARCLSMETQFSPNMDEVVTALEQLQDTKNAARSPKKDHQLNHRSQSTGGTWTFRRIVEASKRTTSYPRPTASPLYA